MGDNSRHWYVLIWYYSQVLSHGSHYHTWSIVTWSNIANTEIQQSKMRQILRGQHPNFERATYPTHLFDQKIKYYWSFGLYFENFKLFNEQIGHCLSYSQTLPEVLLVGNPANQEDVIKWKHFPHYWPFVRGIHRSPVNSPHKGQWRGALMFSLICIWINGWVNNRQAGDLRRHHAHYDVTGMYPALFHHSWWTATERLPHTCCHKLYWTPSGLVAPKCISELGYHWYR